MEPKSARGSGSYHHGDLKTALLHAARELLEQDGPEAISFRAIARTAGVSQTAPYHHFQNKEDLLATLAGTGFRELRSSQEAAATDARRGQERIVALGLDYIRFAVANRQLYRLMFGVGISDWCAHPDVTKIKGESFQPIRAALSEHLSAEGEAGREELETAAVGAWALVHGLSMLIIDGSLAPAPGTESNTQTMVSRAVELFVSGLRST